MSKIGLNRQWGQLIENFVQRNLSQAFPNAEFFPRQILNGPGGKRVTDLLVKIGDQLYNIECKSNIPGAGSAFRRLVGQLKTFSAPIEEIGKDATVLVYSNEAEVAASALTRISGEIGYEAGPHVMRGMIELIDFLKLMTGV